MMLAVAYVQLLKDIRKKGYDHPDINSGYKTLKNAVKLAERKNKGTSNHWEYRVVKRVEDIV